MTQPDVLDVIRINGPVTVREVCMLLGSEDLPNISKKVTQLNRWGLIERCGVLVSPRGNTATLYRAAGEEVSA